MFDENLIATLERSLRETRNAQNRLMGRLREVELESERLREEITALENSAAQTESAIDSLLVNLRSGNRVQRLGSSMKIEEDYSPAPLRKRRATRHESGSGRGGSVTYLNEGRIPSRTSNIQPISHRFADRTITQACTLLLREAGKPLHVNELYNLLVAGGMEFKGNNPTISVAVSLNRNRRFRKVDPGTFDLVMRDASQQAAS